ncbi:hypothetical protein E4T43_04945 [Aureobasidium subglaciale]|nr:hypothetical protein E4T43_04945 [Aureobasidium subglaciale]
MAPKVGDYLKRLGLRGAEIRKGEGWRTQEIKDLEADIRAFYQKYEPYLKRGEDYPVEFDTDIDAVLAKHGPILWPDGPRDETTTKWLWSAGEIDEYPEDLYYSRHVHKIQPVLRALLIFRVSIYRSNQRHAENRRREAAAAAAAGVTSGIPPPPGDDLTDFDNSTVAPSLVHTIKLESDEGKARLQDILKNEEFNLRKRKEQTDSPLDSIKRLKQAKSTPIKDRYVHHMPTWTTTNHETIHVANPQHLENGHALLFAAASGPANGSSPVNHTQQNEQPMQHQQQQALESDDDGSVIGRAAFSLHSSEASSPTNAENLHLPDTPGEGVLPSQYSLPQDTTSRVEGDETTTGPTAQKVPDCPTGMPLEESAPQISRESLPWSQVKKRRAKRSKIALRPMLDNEDTNNTPELSGRGSQAMDGLSKRLPIANSESPMPTDENASTESRRLVRRTHVRTPASEPSKHVATTSSVAASPSIQLPKTQQEKPLTPLPTQPRTYKTPYADVQPLQPTQQPAATPNIFATPGLHSAPVDSPFTNLAPATINQQSSTGNTSLSAKLITRHFGKTFVKFNLTANNRSSLKMIKLTDCLDAVTLHETINNRFKHTLAGLVPSEIIFTSNDTDYDIGADEGGQILWEEFLQTLVDTAPQGTCPIVAEVRV